MRLSLLRTGKKPVNTLSDGVPEGPIEENRSRNFNVLGAELLPSASLHRRQPGQSRAWQKPTLLTPAPPRGQHEMTTVPDGQNAWPGRPQESDFTFPAPRNDTLVESVSEDERQGQFG